MKISIDTQSWRKEGCQIIVKRKADLRKLKLLVVCMLFGCAEEPISIENIDDRRAEANMLMMSGSYRAAKNAFEEILRTEYSGISDATDYCDVERKALRETGYSEQCYFYLTELLPLVSDDEYISGKFSSSETAYFEMLLALTGRYGTVGEYCKRLKLAFRRNSISREFSELYYSDTETERCKKHWDV